MTPIRILLADDDDDDRFLFVNAFSESSINASIDTVVDGQQLTDLIDVIEEPPPPDIIFLDINMPCKSGIDCLKEIRQKKSFNLTPIIMFSTSANKKDIHETFANGANRYIVKTDFFGNEPAILKKLFTPNWKHLLLNSAKEEFVLKQ